MNTAATLSFSPSKAVQTRPDDYIEITVDCAQVFESWKTSLYSFEWLNQDGNIKSIDELSETEAAKRRAVEDTIQKGQALDNPVLGIGMMDNIEIGSGRAVFLTLYDQGITTMSVHIRKNSEDDFKAFHA